jgi:hypothetical protein
VGGQIDIKYVDARQQQIVTSSNDIQRAAAVMGRTGHANDKAVCS